MEKEVEVQLARVPQGWQSYEPPIAQDIQEAASSWQWPCRRYTLLLGIRGPCNRGPYTQNLRPQWSAEASWDTLGGRGCCWAV